MYIAPAKQVAKAFETPGKPRLDIIVIPYVEGTLKLNFNRAIAIEMRAYPESHKDQVIINITKENLERVKGLNLSEAVMIALTKKGLGRQKAHEIVREIAMKAYANKTSLLEELLKDERIMNYFTKEELEELLKPENYLGTAKERVNKVVEWVKSVMCA